MYSGVITSASNISVPLHEINCPKDWLDVPQVAAKVSGFLGFSGKLVATV